MSECDCPRGNPQLGITYYRETCPEHDGYLPGETKSGVADWENGKTKEPSPAKRLFDMVYAWGKYGVVVDETAPAYREACEQLRKKK